MFSELIEQVKAQHSNELPFVIYRKPREEKVNAILQVTDDLHEINEYVATGFVFAPFDSKKPAVLLKADIINSAIVPPQVFDLKREAKTVKVDASQKARHLKLVNKAIDEISRNVIKKVVLSRKVEFSCEVSIFRLFEKMLNSYESAFCYLWYHPKVGTWLGATPEILLKTENQSFTTMSLAGTQNADKEQMIAWGKKEIQEQQLVTDYIVDVLKNKVAGLRVSDKESIKAGQLWHLRTKLIGRIQKGDLTSVIQALHPTPAVCGIPLKEAKKFILKNEGYAREYYTGFLGELNMKSNIERTKTSRNQENKAYRSIKNCTTLFVNLRCMQLKNDKAMVYVGGGVTLDSIAEKEWQETVDKSTTILKVLDDN